MSNILYVSFTIAEDTHVLECAPINEDFVSSISKTTTREKTSELQKTIGYRPSPVNLKHQMKSLKEFSCRFPSRYDLRFQNKITNVKDQGHSNTCWSFATYGSLESTLLPKERWDFSENNLKNTHGFDLAHDDGGSLIMSIAYLSRWSGPVNESCDPYSEINGTSPDKLPVMKHIQKVVLVPLRKNSNDNSSIKKAISNYGGIYTVMHFNDDYYNPNTASYYYDGTTISNHAVVIVGWDDNYSRYNFSKIPSGDGAFIVKNSKGTNWGRNGYFYVSYYDNKFGYDENALFIGESKNNYDFIYQYDPLGWVASIGYSGSSGWFANIFTAVHNELLKAISLYTPTENSTYELRVYKGVSNYPTSGCLVCTQTGTISEAGYFTIPLRHFVELIPNQKFAIVLKLTTPNYNYPISIEIPIAGYSSKADACPNQSYISENGKAWTDLTTIYTDGNVCIKAFTVKK